MRFSPRAAMLEGAVDDPLDQLCAAAAAAGASDVLAHEGRSPHFRVAGVVSAAAWPPLGSEFFDSLWARCGAGDAGDFDAALPGPGGLRLRVNLLRSLGLRGAVVRLVGRTPPALDALGVPADVLRRWASARQGLVLVCGSAGAGKSTTLAALLAWMNTVMARHVVTIEEPVEYAFADGSCVFTQRDVGIDTPSHGEGLRRLLRQSPDVILLGEIRDAASASAAIEAAETGHLVLATLHAPDCVDALDRLDGLFEPPAREAVRRALGAQLLGVLCQKLLPAVEGGLTPACEFFSNQAAARQYVAEARNAELAEWIAGGDGAVCQGFLAAVAQLVRRGLIATETAMSAVGRPQDLSRVLRGVSASASATRRHV